MEPTVLGAAEPPLRTMTPRTTTRIGPNVLREAQAQITEDALATVDQLRSLLALLQATEAVKTGLAAKVPRRAA
jgi:hypothetical protein